jgi:hypothetical protein
LRLRHKGVALRIGQEAPLLARHLKWKPPTRGADLPSHVLSPFSSSWGGRHQRVYARLQCAMAEPRRMHATNHRALLFPSAHWGEGADPRLDRGEAGEGGLTSQVGSPSPDFLRKSTSPHRGEVKSKSVLAECELPSFAKPRSK